MLWGTGLRHTSVCGEKLSGLEARYVPEWAYDSHVLLGMQWGYVQNQDQINELLSWVRPFNKPLALHQQQLETLFMQRNVSQREDICKRFTFEKWLSRHNAQRCCR